MYCIAKDLPIDLPYMILSHIKNTLNSKDAELPYDMLITLIAERMKVNLNDRELQANNLEANDIANYDHVRYSHLKFAKKIPLEGTKSKKPPPTPKGNKGKKRKSTTVEILPKKMTRSAKKETKSFVPVDEEETDSSLDRMFGDQPKTKKIQDAGKAINLDDDDDQPEMIFSVAKWNMKMNH